jgi:hypothetical protein
LEGQQHSLFSYFLSLSGDTAIGTDKMINKAKGLGWHKKQKKKGIITKGFSDIDRQATWGKSNANSWTYCIGHLQIAHINTLFRAALCG